MQSKRDAMENPIVSRVLQLRGQWRAFVRDERARMLHWVIAPNEWPMIRAFVEHEDHVLETDDLFLIVDVPFENEDTYGSDIVSWLAAEYAEVGPELEAEGLNPAWVPPPTEGARSASFLRAVESFQRHQEPLYRRLVLILAPSRVADAAGFVEWIDDVLHHARVESVRFVALDYGEANTLAGVAYRYADRVRTVIAGLDMPRALEQICEGAGSSTPAAKFRLLNVRLLNAVAAKDLVGARQFAAEAALIAHQEDWPHLAYAVHFELGAGCLHVEDPLSAIKEFAAAAQLAEEMHEHGVEFGRVLQLRARMAAATACLVAEGLTEAADAFDRTAILASEVEDAGAEIDCLRLAGYSWARAGKLQAAWDAGVRGLNRARTFDADVRRATTLAHLGHAMLELCKRSPFCGRDRWIEEEMVALLGRDWRSLGTGALETTPPPNTERQSAMAMVS